MVCSFSCGVDAQGTPNITVTPDPAIGTHGQNLTLTCNTPLGDENITYVWMRNASVELCSANCSDPTAETNATGKPSSILIIIAGELLCGGPCSSAQRQCVHPASV